MLVFHDVMRLKRRDFGPEPYQAQNDDDSNDRLPSADVTYVHLNDHWRSTTRACKEVMSPASVTIHTLASRTRYPGAALLLSA